MTNENLSIESKKDNSEIKKPKKRGRKPKNSLEKTSSQTKKLQKKEKKRKEKIGNHDFGLVEKEKVGISTEHLILHLKINPNDSKFKQSHETEQDLLNYTPELKEPTPYEILSSDSYPCPLNNQNASTLDKKDTLKDIKEEVKKEDIENEDKTLNTHDSEYTEDGKRKWITDNNYTKILNNDNYQNLSAFQKKSNLSNNCSEIETLHHLPAITDVNCWWCCHSFTWNPFVLPIEKESDKVYHSVGCFCCPECCAAYIFESGKRYGEPWKQYSLLHEMISRQISGKNVHIKLAPPRETLHIFGGPYKIDEYRKLNSNYKLEVKITMPPINPMNGVTEEMMVEYVNKKTFVPLDQTRIEKATQELRLKRQKKKNTENTLESFMHLKINS